MNKGERSADYFEHVLDAGAISAGCVEFVIIKPRNILSFNNKMVNCW